MTDDMKRSPLLEEIREAERAKGAMMTALLKAHTLQHELHPGMFKMFRAFTDAEKFNLFMAAFHGSMRSATLLRLLNEAEATGKFQMEWIDDIVNGGRKVVIVPPEERAL